VFSKVLLEMLILSLFTRFGPLQNYNQAVKWKKF